mgnify:FL=1
MNSDYSLAILKDVLKAYKKVLSKEELKEFMASPLYLHVGYLASAALLARSGSISMDEFLDLRFLKEEELAEFLESVGNDFDYFKEDTNEDIVKAFSQMEEFIRTHPLEAEKNSRLRKERIAKIKEFHEQIQSSIQRGA